MAFDIDFEGLENRATFYNNGLAKGRDEGKPVKIVSNGTVALAGNGENFFGVALSIDKTGDVVVVEQRGYVTLPYSGDTPSVGLHGIVADGEGGVKIDETNGIKRWIVSVDTNEQKLTFFLG